MSILRFVLHHVGVGMETFFVPFTFAFLWKQQGWSRATAYYRKVMSK